MALAGLFDPNRVRTEEESLLLERWQQEGSTVVNLSFVMTGGSTPHTVTAGKKLYIATAIHTTSNNAGNIYTIKDGGGGGSTKITFTQIQVSGSTTTMHFKAPLEFSTDVYETATGAGAMVLVGWEE